jgi:hypothetical protein
MRNEGIFVLEWLAWHHLLGFDRIFVVTNDCTDGSDALVARAAKLGLVHHIDQTVAPGQSPQDMGMDHVLGACHDLGLSHLLHIDSDEFLVLHKGTLPALLAHTEAADVVPIPWRMFGDGGVRCWSPGDLVLERNQMAEPAPVPGETKFKCLFRVNSFRRATDHNPLEPTVSNPVVLTPDADPLTNRTLYQRKSSRFRPHALAANARRAQIFHYAVRSEDCFAMKTDRGDGQGKIGETKYDLGSSWHRKANRNDVPEPYMQAHLPAIKALLATWRDDPDLAACERHCAGWFNAQRKAVLGN